MKQLMKCIKAAVVIPFYKNRELLLATLKGLSQQDIPASVFEVIIVDDGETDPGLESIILEHYSNFNMRYLSYSDNRGSAYARNYGWRRTDAEVVIFLDGDQVVQADFIRQHIHFFEQVPANTSILQMGFRNEIDQAHAFEDALSQRETSVDARYSLQEIYSENMQNLKGGWHLCFSHNLSVKRAVLEAAGGFDEEIFQGWGLEDSEFAYNLYKQGVKIVYNPNVLVYHISHPLNWNSNEGYRKWNSNLEAFINKHPDHQVMMQCVFRDFFNPVARQKRIESGDPRPWLTCYTKFEQCIRITQDDIPAVTKSITLKNPDKSALFNRIAINPTEQITVMAPRNNLSLIAAIQTEHEARHVKLFTW
jgi:GT2 family glycosyltransferase